MVQRELVTKCEQVAKQIRKDIVEMTYSTGNVGAHLGGSLSMAEMLATLYMGVLKYDNSKASWEYRDRVILSKGHAALALYSVLAQAGIIDKEALKTYKQEGSKLGAHPSLNGLSGIEFASGSLGQGLSLGVGSSLAMKKKNLSSKVYVFLGDGECAEGSVWEAAASAAHYKLNQLIAVVDENHIQYDGYTDEVMNMDSTEEKWKAFGWEVCKVDGHNVEALLTAYNVKSDKPLVILAQTVKGKGISFMEDNWKYHNARLTKELYEQAMAELEGTK